MSEVRYVLSMLVVRGVLLTRHEKNVLFAENLQTTHIQLLLYLYLPNLNIKSAFLTWNIIKSSKPERRKRHRGDDTFRAQFGGGIDSLREVREARRHQQRLLYSRERAPHWR